MDFGNPAKPVQDVIRCRFFFFNEYSLSQYDPSQMPFRGEPRARRDSLLSRAHLEANLYGIAQHYLLPNIAEFRIDEPAQLP